MRPAFVTGITRALNAIIVLVVLAYAGCFLRVAAGRVGSPFENEWLEGDELHHALRIMNGASWYPRPSLEFFPNVYPPGYPFVCALVMRVVGPSLAAMRWVSLCGTGAACAGIFYSVRRWTSSLYAAISVGLFLGTFRVCGAWFDIARVDMLALGAVVVAVALLERPSTRSRLLAVALLAAACLVKQTAFAFLVPVLALEIAMNLRRGLAALAIAAVLLGLPVWVLQTRSDGWFGFYAWTLPATTPHDPARIVAFFTTDLVALAGPALLVLPAVLPLLKRRLHAPAFLLLLPSALAASLSPRSNPAGYANDLIFASCFLAMNVGLALGQLATQARWRAALPLAQLLVLAQLAGHVYSVRRQLRTEAEEEAGTRAVEKIRQLPTPVVIPKNPYLLFLAGLPMHAQIRRGWANNKRALRLLAERDASIDLPGALAAGLVAGRWGAFVVSEGEPGSDLERLASDLYVPAGRLVASDEGDALYPLTGHRVRPFAIYLRP
jgi:hypothetical protein